MESLIDDCLRMVFKLVNLNDRASLRSMNKRFKAVCDSIPIRKLIVSERMAAKAGQLAYTNEEYAYADTASCFDLRKLFKNPVLLKQMTRLRVLAITGTRLPATQLDLTKFNELDYLSLSQVLLDSPKVLESPNLRYLILDQVYMKTVDELNERMGRLTMFGPSFRNETISVHAFGFDYLKSKNLKYLKLRGKRALEFKFFEYCIRDKLFDSLDELDVLIDDLKPILLAAQSCPNMNAINMITPHDHFFHLIQTTDMSDFFARIKKTNLKVYFYGIEFNQSSFSEVKNFVEQFNFATQEDNLEWVVSKPLLKAIKKLAKNHDVTRFYPLITQVSIRLPCGEFLKEAALFQKLVNCDTLYFDMDDHPDAHLMKYFDYFTRLKCLRVGIHGLRDYNMSNALLNELPKRCPSIMVLLFDCRDPKTNFDFLFEFPQLSTIVLKTEFAFDQTTYVELIRKLKKTLFRLDVCYVAPSNLNREKLRVFKKRVLSCIRKRPDSDKVDFKLNIYTRNSGAPQIGELSFVRCHFRPHELDRVMIHEEEKLYHWARMIKTKAAGFTTSVLRVGRQ